MNNRNVRKQPKKVVFLEKQRITKIAINKMSDSTWIYKNSIIHTSDSILVIVEELVFIYHQTDVGRHDSLNTMETLQRSRTTKRGKINKAIRQIINVIKKNCGKKDQYIAKYRTQILKEILEHNLETHATACKYLNNSRHGKSLLRKQSFQIVDMCDAFIWTIFNLFDLNCTIDSKVRIIFFNYSKVTYIHFIIPYSMDIQAIVYVDFGVLWKTQVCWIEIFQSLFNTL